MKMARKYTLTEMKKANIAAGHYFFQRGNRRFFGPHRAVYDPVNQTNYVVVFQPQEEGFYKFIWYRFDARSGKLSPMLTTEFFHVRMAFRSKVEDSMKKAYAGKRR